MLTGQVLLPLLPLLPVPPVVLRTGALGAGASLPALPSARTTDTRLTARLAAVWPVRAGAAARAGRREATGFAGGTNAPGAGAGFAATIPTAGGWGAGCGGEAPAG